MDEMHARILATLAGAMDGIAARPALPAPPPLWWHRADDDANRTHGPIWSPVAMLGDAAERKISTVAKAILSEISIVG